MRRLMGTLSFCLIFLGIGLNGYAEDSTAMEAWDPPTAGPATTWTSPLCGKGKFVVQPFSFYNRTRGTFNSDGNYGALPSGDKKWQLQQQLFVQYGITEKWEISAQTVYQENFVKQDGIKAHDQGLGDSYLFTRYCLLEAHGLWPHATGLVQLKMPTGKYQHADPDKLGTDLMGAGSGGGSWDPGLGLILTEKLQPFLLHFDAVYNFPQPVDVDGVRTRYGNYFNYDVGVEYVVSHGFNFLLELNGFVQGNNWQDGEGVPSTQVRSLTLSPGIGWSKDRIQALVAYQRVVTGTNTDATDSVVATLVYQF